MSMLLNPYLSFKDNAREAMNFYKDVFGGELTVTTYGEGNMAQSDGDKNKVMHSMLSTSNGFTLMGSDTPSTMDYHPATASISLSGANGDGKDLKTYWDKLSKGGKVTMPLAKAPWGDEFGMCADKYGTNWMVNIAGAH